MRPGGFGVDAGFCGHCGSPIRRAAGTGRLAGWWSRAGASLVDALITAAFNLPTLLYAVSVAVNGGVHMRTGFDGHPHVTYTHHMVVAFLLCVASFAVTTLVYGPLLLRRQGTHNGQTWGKQAAGIRVTRDDGEPMNLGRGLVREVVAKGLIVTAIGRIPVAGRHRSPVPCIGSAERKPASAARARDGFSVRLYGV